MRVISDQMLKIFIFDRGLKIIDLKSQPYLPGANELSEAKLKLWVKLNVIKPQPNTTKH